MHTARKPWWQHATALVTVSAGGVITGFNFVPGAAVTMTSPTSVPLNLLALEQAAQPGALADLAVGGDSTGRVTSDAQLRAAIVNVAGYYLQLAKTKTPAEMEALIWGKTSSDGADHGPSCAAFASLTLELAAQTVGLQSWITGGTYPWPPPAWGDVRVDTNPASPAITSMVADAQAHGRWHPLGDGYTPQPGDWALYNGHVAVVTSYSGGVLDTIAAGSLPNLTVNAQSSAAPPAEQGVTGFIDNGNLKPAAGSLGAGQAATEPAEPPSSTQVSSTESSVPGTSAQPARPATAQLEDAAQPEDKAATPTATGSTATVPGLPAAGALTANGGIPAAGPAAGNGGTHTPATASVPGVLGTGQLLGDVPASPAAEPKTASPPAPAATPAHPTPTPSATQPSPSAQPSSAPKSAPAKSAQPSPSPSATSSPAKQYSTPGTREQQAFISSVAPGAIAAQQRYGVPASVTIAQAIEESAWGQSGLATQYHNLFGIKGTGPAGSVTLPTQEYEGGQWVTIDAPFAVYHNDAESIADHAELLATSGYYTRAMADRNVPDAFANDLTGVYATDPNYGANLIALMKLYNLYQYDSAPAATPAATPAPTPAPSSHATATPTPAATPTATATPTAAPSGTATPAASPAAHSGNKATSSPAATGHADAGQAGSGKAAVPGVGTPDLAPSAPSAAASDPSVPGAAVSGAIPGLVSPASVPSGLGTPVHVTPATRPASTKEPAASGSRTASRGSTPSRGSTATGSASTGSASIPGLAAPGPGTGSSPAAVPSQAAPATAAGRGGPRPATVVTTAYITPAPGTPAPTTTAPATTAPATTGPATAGHAATGHVTTSRATRTAAVTGHVTAAPAATGRAPSGAAWYEATLPAAVATALFANAKGPLSRGQHLYRDVAADTGCSWKMLAAVDWMQCKADPRYSPVAGEKLGSLNDDGTSYTTKSAALTQCARDLIELSLVVYGIDLTARRPLSVRELAAAFAAFRWGAILKRHRVSPMEFPYSVAGLTAQHQKMHWPAIDAPDAPDRPGARFREPFGAVPVVLSLGYPATV